MSGFTGVIVIVVVLFLANPCFAVNPFDMGRVEYFSDGKTVGQGLAKIQEPIDWREPVIGADGKTTYYVPPDPVIQLLNDPTPENAKTYMDWQNQKTERIIKAQEALVRIQEKIAK